MKTEIEKTVIMKMSINEARWLRCFIENYCNDKENEAHKKERERFIDSLDAAGISG